jgi:hypothetical protein
MTNKSSADGVRDQATADDSSHTHQAPDRRPWVAAIVHRWPTWLAIAMAVLLAAGGTTVGELADVLPMLALAYLAAAVLQRRKATWPLAVGIVAAFAALVSLSEFCIGSRVYQP